MISILIKKEDCCCKKNENTNMESEPSKPQQNCKDTRTQNQAYKPDARNKHTSGRIIPTVLTIYCPVANLQRQTGDSDQIKTPHTPKMPTHNHGQNHTYEQKERLKKPIAKMNTRAKITKPKHNKSKRTYSYNRITNHFQHKLSLQQLKEKYAKHREHFCNCDLKKEKVGHVQLLLPHNKDIMRCELENKLFEIQNILHKIIKKKYSHWTKQRMQQFQEDHIKTTMFYENDFK